ncbi:hypothetical protein SETIT_9G338600v2 [Setaria italica]|uniref:Uncharacterized protein n=1 Tax=Setaria italica TaxID=4555 RepID=A0A368SNM5_SETIT|nr:hypothetical protein SETIT_9G338600v2 [Setaria italica]
MDPFVGSSCFYENNAAMGRGVAWWSSSAARLNTRRGCADILERPGPREAAPAQRAGAWNSCPGQDGDREIHHPLLPREEIVAWLPPWPIFCAPHGIGWSSSTASNARYNGARPAIKFSEHKPPPSSREKTATFSPSINYFHVGLKR